MYSIFSADPFRRWSDKLIIAVNITLAPIYTFNLAGRLRYAIEENARYLWKLTETPNWQWTSMDKF